MRGRGLIMNSYVIELKDGSVIYFDADFIETKDGFFLFYKENISPLELPGVIKYQSFDTVNHITLQKEKHREGSIGSIGVNL